MFFEMIPKTVLIMKNKPRYFFLILILIFVCPPAFYAQELISPLYDNQELKKKIRENKNTNIPQRSTRSVDTFDLNKNAFFDQFSGDNYYPDSNLWMDFYVYLNDRMAYKPVSLGTATFDGLDAYGNPYNPDFDPNNSKDTKEGYKADQLTSVPIDLSGAQWADSIYLSFFYQAGAFGEMPDHVDSFKVFFKPVRYLVGNQWDSSAWVQIWSTGGGGNPFRNFKQILLPVPPYIIDTTAILDTVAYFYHKAFQFRFVSYGNLSGNMDHWHLDYVYFAKNRSRMDSFAEDFSVIASPLSLIETYRSMPWSHLKKAKNKFRTKNEISIRNNWHSDGLFDNIGHTIKELISGTTFVSNYNADATNVFKGRDTSRTVFFDTLQINNMINVLNQDTVILETSLFGSFGSDIRPENDTARSYQVFNNYYAYDDGSPEGGYGFDNIEGTIRVAYEFKTPLIIDKNDSLRGLAIFFNRSMVNVGGYPFNILIWPGSKKEEPIVIETRVPDIEDSIYNDFVYYRFDEAIRVQGTFYVGWEQFMSFNINIGADMHYYELNGNDYPGDVNPYLSYYRQNIWYPSTIRAALMIRPYVTSDTNLFVDTKKIVQRAKPDFCIYPNPARDILNINGIAKEGMRMQIYDLSAKIMIDAELMPGTQSLDISFLNSGYYIVRITDTSSGKTDYRKLIKY
jgi:hypothetical protein